MRPAGALKEGGLPVTRKLIGCVFLLVGLTKLTGCTEPADERAKEIGSSIERIYSGGLEGATWVLDKYGQEKISAFCVLAAYEEKVVGTSGVEAEVNAHLRNIQYRGVEGQWGLALVVAGEVVVVRFNMRDLPLVAPRPSFGVGNCVTSEKITVYTTYNYVSGRGAKKLRISFKEEN